MQRIADDFTSIRQEIARLEAERGGGTNRAGRILELVEIDPDADFVISSTQPAVYALYGATISINNPSPKPIGYWLNGYGR